MHDQLTQTKERKRGMPGNEARLWCHADYSVVLFFTYPVHAGSASEVSRVGVGVQVFSFHLRTAVFYPSVEHSVYLHSFLWSAVIVYPLKSLPS